MGRCGWVRVDGPLAHPIPASLGNHLENPCTDRNLRPGYIVFSSLCRLKQLPWGSRERFNSPRNQGLL